MRRRNAFRSCVQACEVLELRAVPSSASLVDGVLTVTGSNGNNAIIITEGSTQVLVKIDKSAQRTFQKNLIGDVHIFGLSGNDKITVDLQHLSAFSYRSFTADGGRGNDVIFLNVEYRSPPHYRVVLRVEIGGITREIGEILDVSVFRPAEGNSPAEIDSLLFTGHIELVDELASIGAAIFGGEGNDRLVIGGNGLISGASLYGGKGNDTLIGSKGNDFLYGDQGNDSLTGSDGNDELYGGSGNDRMFGNNGTDFLLDVVGTNFLDGGNNDDRLSVGSRRNTILGGAGNDDITIEYLTPQGVVDGGLGADFLYGPNVLFGGFSGSDEVDRRLFEDVQIIAVEYAIRRH